MKLNKLKLSKTEYPVCLCKLDSICSRFNNASRKFYLFKQGIVIRPENMSCNRLAIKE
jgi:hypothetical protein